MHYLVCNVGISQQQNVERKLKHSLQRRFHVKNLGVLCEMLERREGVVRCGCVPDVRLHLQMLSFDVNALSGTNLSRFLLHSTTAAAINRQH